MRSHLTILWASLLLVGPARSQVRVHVLDGTVQLMEGHETASSIAAALARVAEARAAGDASPATIYLAQRTYWIEAPIELDAGLVGEGLSIEAAPACEPTLSGGRRITGFSARPDGTWCATIDAVRAGEWWFEQLFVDGARATRARHPNESYARVIEAGPDNRTSFSFDPSELSTYRLDTRSEVVLLHDWSISRVRIAGVDVEGARISVADPIGCQAPHYAITNFEPHPRFFVEGSPRLVDAPGEWALDRETGQVTYAPLPGQTLESAEVIAPLAPALLRASGSPESPLRGLRLRGIRLAHTSWPIPDYGYAEGQAAFYERRDVAGSGGTRDTVPAAIELEWVEGAAIEGCTIESVGASGVWIGAGCRDCALRDTVVRDAGGNGVLIGEAAGRMVNGKPWWQSAPEQSARENTVEHCLVERCGQRFFGAVGIWIGLAQSTTVARCEVRYLPYSGISVGWRWDDTPTPCRENLLEENHIHHVMQTLSDGGGVYTLGRQPGTVLRGNAIHDVRRNEGRAPSNGIFFDQGTSETLTRGNVFWAIDTTPLRWHWTHENRIAENTFVLSEGQEIARYDRAQAEDIEYADNVRAPSNEWSSEAARSITGRAGPRPRDRR
jgi:hypothetical protein